jgi:glutaminyl-tRNA synthetase
MGQGVVRQRLFPEDVQYAENLILQGDAYICDLSAEEVKAYRGTLTEPGRESPYRNRPVRENLDLFRSMRDGRFPEEAEHCGPE